MNELARGTARDMNEHNNRNGMHSHGTQQEIRFCPTCGKPFTPEVPWQDFDKPKCRTLYNKLHGTAGRVVVNRSLSKGRTSITLHFDGPAAKTARNVAHGAFVYLAVVRPEDER